MSEISGTANYDYDTVYKMLSDVLESKGFSITTKPRTLKGHGDKQREVITFLCYNKENKIEIIDHISELVASNLAEAFQATEPVAIPHGGLIVKWNGTKPIYSAEIQITEFDIEKSKIKIISLGDDKAWREVTDIIRATGYAEFDNEKKKLLQLAWKDVDRLHEKMKIIFFNAMAKDGDIPHDRKELRQKTIIYLLHTPRYIDDKTESNGYFMTYCEQEKHWRKKIIGTIARRDKPIWKNVLGFDVDNLLKYYDKLLKK